jgi:hypothetical protein
VNTVSHPEGQYFRVYGIQEGKPTLVYHGGGGGCRYARSDHRLYLDE